MKAAFLIILSLFTGMPLAAWGQDAATQPEVKISQVREGDIIQIFAENVSDHSLTITVQLSDIVNAKSEGWPTKSVKRCLPGDRILMTALIQTGGAPPAKFNCTMTTSTEPPAQPQQAQSPQEPSQPLQPRLAEASGPPARVAAVKKVVLEPVDPNFGYLLPYEHGTSHTLSQAPGGKQSHTGIFAWDFDMPAGTPVCAARDGQVVEVHKDRPDQDSDMTIGNCIIIIHADGTIALYAQLAANDGVSVAVGQHVKAGDVIGKSGTTGHSNGPHLHFEVEALKDCIGVTKKGARSTIPVLFNIFGQKGVMLEDGNVYEAE